MIDYVIKDWQVKSQQVADDSLISQMMKLRPRSDLPRGTYFVELKNLYFRPLSYFFPFKFTTLKINQFCDGCCHDVDVIVIFIFFKFTLS